MKHLSHSNKDDEELDAGTLQFWRSLSSNPSFHKILEYLSSKKGEYSEHKPPSIHPHIQSERNGGMKAWIRLSTLLINPPTPDPDSVTEKKLKKGSIYTQE
jgi:hypothetical protein